MSCAFHSKFPTNHSVQFRTVDELHNGQSTDWNDETRPQDSDLIVHPARAVVNLVRRRNAIGAARILSGKTAADCCEINLRSKSSLIHPAELFEPTEKRFAGGMREWSLQNRLSRSGCLSDNHDVAHDRAARNRRRLHPRAAPALQQLCDMSF